MLTEAFKTYTLVQPYSSASESFAISSSNTKCFLCDFLSFFSFTFSFWMKCYYHPLQMQQTYFPPSQSSSVGRNTWLRACVNTSCLIRITEAESASALELFRKQLVSTRLKSNRRDTGSRKGLFLLVLLSMLL